MKFFLHRILPFLLLSFYFQNCSSTIARELKGTVIFKQTGEPVEGARVTLLENNNGGNGRVLGQTTTNAEGNFEMIYHRQGGDEWIVHVSFGKLGGSESLTRKQKTVTISL